MWSYLGSYSKDSVGLLEKFYSLYRTVHLCIWLKDLKRDNPEISRITDVTHLRPTRHSFVFVWRKSSQRHFILPRFPFPSTRADIWSERERMRRRKGKVSPSTSHVHVNGHFSIRHVSSWRRQASATVSCFKKLKSREKKMCFVSIMTPRQDLLFSIKTCGDSIICCFFLQNVNTVHICGARECFVIRKGPF